jgi:hypothetical protein
VKVRDQGEDFLGRRLDVDRTRHAQRIRLGRGEAEDDGDCDGENDGDDDNDFEHDRLRDGNDD